ncbi:serine hydrolase domain-containing protein [Microbulbifer magnicolonia]|uniref:serine hydrolase domain-containing protein n=1 Tax=Microbulbifer magnicolonia TaxID=3109744 RepID=UPI002B410D1C|nr:serine hydrolase domain-containing protein [Microbulbifer sp. GG15]
MRTWRRKTIVALLAFAGCPLAGAEDHSVDVPAQAGGTLSSKIDTLFQSFEQQAGPGCAVGVIHNGRYLHKAGYGMANLEYKIAIDGATVFRIGSTSKQFTAMAVALLAEQGKIDLDADIREYLPDLIPYQHKVTIRQIIHHLGGMGDYDHPVFKKADGAEFRFGNEDYWTISEFYQRVRQADLELPPGEQWQYSNLGYFLLSQLVEKVSGQTLSQFAAQNIFAPLGMTHTLFNDNVRQIIPRRADGYLKLPGGGYETYMTNLDWVGDGGVYTSLEDFILWDRNFYHNVLGKTGSQLIEQFSTPGENTDHSSEEGTPETYSFGQFHGNLQGQPAIYHSGSWVGFKSFYSRFPELGLSTVMFCNAEHIDARKLSERVIQLSLQTLNINTSR